MYLSMAIGAYEIAFHCFARRAFHARHQNSTNLFLLVFITMMKIQCGQTTRIRTTRAFSTKQLYQCELAFSSTYAAQICIASTTLRSASITGILIFVELFKLLFSTTNSAFLFHNYSLVRSVKEYNFPLRANDRSCPGDLHFGKVALF